MGSHKPISDLFSSPRRFYSSVPWKPPAGFNWADMGQEDRDGLGLYPFDFRPVSPFLEGGQDGVNEETTPLTAGRTVSAGNDKERRDSSPNTAVRAGVGKSYIDLAATGVCGGARVETTLQY